MRPSTSSVTQSGPVPAPCEAAKWRFRPQAGLATLSFLLMLNARHGEGHREAHPAAVADLVPDGGAETGDRARDQAGRRGLLADERRGLRAAVLCRPRGARVAR